MKKLKIIIQSSDKMITTKFKYFTRFKLLHTKKIDSYIYWVMSGWHSSFWAQSNWNNNFKNSDNKGMTFSFSEYPSKEWTLELNHSAFQQNFCNFKWRLTNSKKKSSITQFWINFITLHTVLFFQIFFMMCIYITQHLPNRRNKFIIAWNNW